MVWVSNYLASIDRELSDELVTEEFESLTNIRMSPLRVEVQTNIREHIEYIDEYQTKKIRRSSGGNVTGIGIGMMVGGLILGGWLGVGLALFGGASLFEGGNSWDDEELEKIRKPITKQIKEFTLASLNEPYRKLTDEMLTHLDKVLNKELKSLLGQVEKLARNNHDKNLMKMADIEKDRSNADETQVVSRLQTIITKIEEMLEQVRGMA